MEEIFRKVTSIKGSSKHIITMCTTYVNGTHYISVYVHKVDEYGSTQGIAESINTILNSFDEVYAFVIKWAEIIAKEREHDEAINASESRMDS